MFYFDTAPSTLLSSSICSVFTTEKQHLLNKSSSSIIFLSEKGSNESFLDIVTSKLLFDVVALTTICHLASLKRAATTTSCEKCQNSNFQHESTLSSFHKSTFCCLLSYQKKLIQRLKTKVHRTFIN